jgi:hypothetical protein
MIGGDARTDQRHDDVAGFEDELEYVAGLPRRVLAVLVSAAQAEYRGRLPLMGE